jgi:hypothetical protein
MSGAEPELLEKDIQASRRFLMLVFFKNKRLTLVMMLRSEFKQLSEFNCGA